jgi:hypothetical protein
VRSKHCCTGSLPGRHVCSVTVVNWLTVTAAGVTQGANGQRGLVLNPAVLRRSAKRVHTAVATRRGPLLGAHIADDTTTTANDASDDVFHLRGTRSAGSALPQSR